MPEGTRVVVAMSGGVDSSVAAALLQQQGHDVVGMMLRLWSEPDREDSNRCCTPDAMAQARRVAAMLSIPFYPVDAQEIFFNRVVTTFTRGYQQGITPNPCLECNRFIRWEFLYNHARSTGASYLATGHYARIGAQKDGSFRLMRALDLQKDQSYVLHVLKQEGLAHSLFPLGDYTKDQVRRIARELKLPVAERAESQDLCFLGGQDYRPFLRRWAPQVENPGPILDLEGRQIGTHQGLAFYTIGQRKGIGVASPIPLYVLEKNTENNSIIVGPIEQLGRDELLTGPVNWISGEAPNSTLNALVKTRYTARETLGEVTPLVGGGVHIRFSQALRDITPGQAAVFYDGATCLGGGVIQS